MAVSGSDPTADALAALRGLGSNPSPQFSASSASANDPLVYVGFHGEHEAQGPGTVPASNALAQFYSWSDEERAQWGKRLYAAGFTKNPDDWDSQLEGWKYAVNNASSYYTAAGKQMTPWAFMDMKEAAYNRNGSNPNSPTTSTSTSVNLPSKSDAQAAITAMFKDQLGRAPEQGEIDKYTSMMLAQYRKNPNRTLTTTRTDASGNTTSNSTQSGGFNPQGWLEDQVQGDSEYGAYQAATTYFNALQGAIGAGADVG